MYDIIFISYNEPNADENYALLKQRFPLAKRVNGVTGIHQAHVAAAKKSFTKMFWVVDGDAVILDSFNFDYVVPDWDLETVHVWSSRNPINDLTYGYGGVKLLPKQLTINMDTNTVDMTTSISTSFKPMPQESNITAFNTDPFNTWKSAFRECVKLSSNVIPSDTLKHDAPPDKIADIHERLTTSRLHHWCTKWSNRPFSDYALKGALAGKEYGEKNASNPEALLKINDFTWLQDRWSLEKFPQ